MQKSDIYTRFINLSRALELSEHARLNANLKHLLSYIVIRIDAEQSTRVSDLIQIKTLGSPATIHTRIQRLIDLNYLTLITDEHDARIKHVKLGNAGEAYVCGMSGAILALLGQNPC
jgi:DNA-binding MarR family transcriptional regulator